MNTVRTFTVSDDEGEQTVALHEDYKQSLLEQGVIQWDDERQLYMVPADMSWTNVAQAVAALQQGFTPPASPQTP